MAQPVLKTYKVFIDGKFPRSESGRTYALKDKKNITLANICLCSRKDLKAAVVAARNAQSAWSTRSAFNRSQILYRIAEMMEGRKSQFIDELKEQGMALSAAKTEVRRAIDIFVYYAGWCDKFQTVYSSVNPVASLHYNFSVPEPMGVVCILAPLKSPLAGLASVIASVICGGNTCCVLASTLFPMSAITMSESIATGDLPAGVVNIITGDVSELAVHMSTHLDVNALISCINDKALNTSLEKNCSLNVKRFFNWNEDWISEKSQGPEKIMQLQEIKTTWHPIENIGSSGSRY